MITALNLKLGRVLMEILLFLEASGKRIVGLREQIVKLDMSTVMRLSLS